MATDLLRPADFTEWRLIARDLLARDIAPHLAQWQSDDQPGELDLFAALPAPAAPAADADAAAAAGPIFSIPATLLELLQSAACCRVDQRWAFLYRVLWRWRQGEYDVISAADPDGARLHGMVKAVHREQHDMHAYVRFRERPEALGAPQFVAWFEPRHDVLPQVGRHFAARMGKATWVLATPDATLSWDGATLQTLAPVMRGPFDIDDAGEALWLTYYRSIFNPARLNERLLHSHIPHRFWKNLPEGAEVPEMVTQAANGARGTGQTRSVGERGGKVVQVSAEQAQPVRADHNPDPG